MSTPLFLEGPPYRLVNRFDATARLLASRHYSRKKGGHRHSRQFVGPGKPMVLLGVKGDWLFIWRLSLHRMDGQAGVECSLFRNESKALSSEIILLCEGAWDRDHGPTRKYTYVDPTEIASSNHGWCFKKAGWKKIGESLTGLHLLAKEAP